MSALRRNNRVLAAALAAFVGSMVGLAYASVPLYRLFCQVTGYGGTPQTGERAKTAAERMTPGERQITVELDANVSTELPWRFEPEQRRIRVRLGEQALVYYRAKNLSDRPVTGMATFNVSPHKVGSFFSKIECFCFTEQTLQPGEEVAMPVSFFVDPALAESTETRDVGAIILSYTFFRALKETPKERNVSTAPAGSTAPPGRS